MKKLTLRRPSVDVSNEEETLVRGLLGLRSHAHCLAFANSFTGFNPFAAMFESDKSIKAKGKEIIEEVSTSHRVYSLAPRYNVTMFPIRFDKEGGYEIDMVDFERNLKEVLKLNDRVFKARYLLVDLNHGPKNTVPHVDKAHLIPALYKLLEKSRFLKAIYLDWSAAI